MPRLPLKVFSPLANFFTFKTLADLELTSVATAYPITFDTGLTFTFFVQALGFLILFASSTMLFRRSSHRNGAALTICLISAFVGFFGLIQKLSGATQVFWIFERGWTFFGPYISKNHAGGLFAACTVLCIGILPSYKSVRGRSAILIALFLNALALFFTGSRAAFLTLVVTLFVYFFRPSTSKGRKNQQFIILTTFLVVSLLAVLWNADLILRLFGPSQSTGPGIRLRSEIWKWALALWYQVPFAGIGFGTFSKVSPMMVGDSMWLHPEHVENDYIELLICGGLVGFGIIITFLFFVLRQVRKVFKMKAEASTRRAFALAMIALLFNACFVFHAPLPAHQIFFAILLGGILAPADILADSLLRKAFVMACICGLFFGTWFAFTGPPQENLSAQGITHASSPAEQQALFQLQLIEAEKELADEPRNSNVLYNYAITSAYVGDVATAKTAAQVATHLDPFNVGSRRKLAQAFHTRNQPKTSLEIIDPLVESPAPLTGSLKTALRVEAALYALHLGKKDLAERYLESAKSILPWDWRIAMIRAFIKPANEAYAKTSWIHAKNKGVDSRVWDRWFVSLVKSMNADTSGATTNIRNLLDSVGPEREDAGIFLQRLHMAKVSSAKDIFISLSRHKTSPWLKANTNESKANWKQITENGVRGEPEQFEINVVRHQPGLDLYYIPTNILAYTDTLSFRMRVESSRDLGKQLALIIDGREILLTPDSSIKNPDGSFDLTYIRAGKAVKTKAELGKITGVGFTPLEKNGLYRVGPVQVFVDSPR